MFASHAKKSQCAQMNFSYDNNSTNTIMQILLYSLISDLVV